MSRTVWKIEVICHPKAWGFPPIKVCTAFPQDIIDNLRKHGAVVHDACKILIIDVLDQESIHQFDLFLYPPASILHSLVK